jgi:hypothetical protein
MTRCEKKLSLLAAPRAAEAKAGGKKGVKSDQNTVVLWDRRLPALSPKTSFEAQPQAVRSVADSLTLRDIEGINRYVSQYKAANRGVRS